MGLIIPAFVYSPKTDCLDVAPKTTSGHISRIERVAFFRVHVRDPLQFVCMCFLRYGQIRWRCQRPYLGHGFKPGLYRRDCPSLSRGYLLVTDRLGRSVMFEPVVVLMRLNSEEVGGTSRPLATNTKRFFTCRTI